MTMMTMMMISYSLNPCVSQINVLLMDDQIIRPTHISDLNVV